MSTHDYDLANQAGAAFRADINSALLAIVSNNSSATAPATMFAYQFWADTTSGILKQRNAANTAWIDILTLSTGKVLLAVAADTATNQSGGTVAATTISASSSILSSSPTAGIGYSTGAGGTVTQITDINTSVTLNKICGEIVTVSHAFVGGTPVSFTLNNTAIDGDNNTGSLSYKINTGVNPTIILGAFSFAVGSCSILMHPLFSSTASLKIKFSVNKIVIA